MTLVAAVAVITLALGSMARAQHVPFFAPTPGPGTSFSRMHGTLLGWGNGNGMASFEVAASGRTYGFIAGRGITFDGNTVNCYSAPLGSATPGPGCAGWPRGVHAGVTNVTVTYFALPRYPAYAGAAVRVISDAYASRTRATHGTSREIGASPGP